MLAGQSADHEDHRDLTAKQGLRSDQNGHIAIGPTNIKLLGHSACLVRPARSGKRRRGVHSVACNGMPNTLRYMDQQQTIEGGCAVGEHTAQL